MTPLETAELSVKACLNKKATDIKLLEVTELTTIADYYLICTAGSAPQMKAIYEEVDRIMSANGIEPLHVEGVGTSGWVLLDYGTVVIHIFTREVREFYSLERLWADAKSVDIDNIK